MKQLQKIEYKRPDQTMIVYKGKHNIFFVYSYRGVERCVFTNPHQATEYAKSPLTSDVEPDYRVTLNNEEVQNEPEHTRQGYLDHLAMEYCVTNDINNNLINPFK